MKAFLIISLTFFFSGTNDFVFHLFISSLILLHCCFSSAKTGLKTALYLSTVNLRYIHL
eukprot:UN03830